jgi:hypothetical protein
MTFKVKNPKLKEKKVPYEIRTYKVYSFENLPEDAKKKVLEKYRYRGVEGENLAEEDDFIIDMGLKEKTLKVAEKKVGQGNTLFSWKTARYNVDYGYKYIQFVDLKVNDDEAFRQELGISKKTWDKVSYSFDNSGRKTNTLLEFNAYDANVELTKDEEVELDNARQHFNTLMVQANKNLEKDYEYRMSDESLIDGFEANEYKFTEKGDID